MRVKNVKAKSGDDESTTQIVEWDDISDDASEDEIKYCVYLRSQNNTSTREEVTDKCIISFSALQPATKYRVNVYAINRIGAGKWSEECFFKTGEYRSLNNRRITVMRLLYLIEISTNHNGLRLIFRKMIP